MRRTKLIWFALGAASSAAAAFVGVLLVPEKQKNMPFLVVWEDMDSMESSEDDMAWRSAEIVRNCGGTAFKAIPGAGSHPVDSTWVPIGKTKNFVISCAIEQAQIDGLALSFESEKGS